MRLSYAGTKFHISLILLFLCCAVTSPAGEQVRESQQITAILGAFEREITVIEDRLGQRQERIIEGIRFVSGILNGQKVVVTWTGVGKVNAAMTTTLLIEHYKPKHVIFTGIAGGVNPELQPGDIVVSAKTAQHDMGTFWPEGLFCKGVKSRLDGYENPVFFLADPVLLAAAKKAADHADLDSIKTIRRRENPENRSGDYCYRRFVHRLDRKTCRIAQETERRRRGDGGRRGRSDLLPARNRLYRYPQHQ